MLFQFKNFSPVCIAICFFVQCYHLLMKEEKTTFNGAAAECGENVSRFFLPTRPGLVRKFFLLLLHIRAINPRKINARMWFESGYFSSNLKGKILQCYYLLSTVNWLWIVRPKCFSRFLVCFSISLWQTFELNEIFFFAFLLSACN